MKSPRSTQAEHHIHQRKRIHLEQLKDYHVLDHLVYFAGPLIPIAILPQVHKVWVERQTEGTYLVTWVMLSFAATVMALYAIKHREWPLMLTYIPLVVLDLAVVIGLLVVK